MGGLEGGREKGREGGLTFAWMVSKNGENAVLDQTAREEEEEGEEEEGGSSVQR